MSPSRFDNFAYFYHRFDYPKLDYTLCTDKSITRLHKQFLPKSFWAGHTQDDLDRVHHLLRKEIWQVPSYSEMSHEVLVKYVNEVIGGLDPNDDSSSSATITEKKDHGYLMLNYHWQKSMGDFALNGEAFPNLTETVEFVRWDKGQTLLIPDAD